jgi:CRP/FNR family transcriptional regulator, cyclic AMP receptor protein
MRPAAPDPALLAMTPLFAGLSLEELTQFAGYMHERTFSAGASFLTLGQPGEAIYVLLTGSVKVSTIRPDGTEVILAVLGAGEVVGEMSLADSLGRSADVTTLEETTLLWMDRTAFRSGVVESPVLARNLAEILSRRLRLANANLLSLAALDVPGRVASQILALAREYGEQRPEGLRIPMRLTQADLAGLVGASRVRVNQAFGYLRKRHAISVGADGRITVLDEEIRSRRAG